MPPPTPPHVWHCTLVSNIQCMLTCTSPITSHVEGTCLIFISVRNTVPISCNCTTKASSPFRSTLSACVLLTFFTILQRLLFFLIHFSNIDIHAASQTCHASVGSSGSKSKSETRSWKYPEKKKSWGYPPRQRIQSFHIGTILDSKPHSP